MLAGIRRPRAPIAFVLKGQVKTCVHPTPLWVRLSQPESSDDDGCTRGACGKRRVCFFIHRRFLFFASVFRDFVVSYWPDRQHRWPLVEHSRSSPLVVKLLCTLRRREKANAAAGGDESLGAAPVFIKYVLFVFHPR